MAGLGARLTACGRILSPVKSRSRKSSRLARNPRLARFSSLASIILAAGVFLGSAEAAPVELPQVSFRKVTLSNGLEALLVEDHQSPVVSVEIWYHVGSKDELAGQTGYAHLFEHLMFEGTKNLGPEEFSDYIVRSGGIDNAYTNEDATVFWATIPSSELPVALWLEADRMRNLQITESALTNEREVVKEERRQRFDNQPYGRVIEALYERAFTVHPYRHTPIGSMEDLDHATLAGLQSFYDLHYVPNNAFLVVVGDFDAGAAEELVRKYFEHLPRGPDASGARRKIPAEPQQTEKRTAKLYRDVGLPAFVEGYHMPADGTPDAYPLRLATKLLSDGESSRLYRRLVYGKQIALEVQSAGNFTEDPNLFFVLALVNPGHTLLEAEGEVDQEIERLKNELVPPRELEKAKNQILRDFILSRQTSRSRAEELGYAAVVLKDPGLINTELARFLDVTSEDIRRAARKYLVQENMTLVEVYPESGAGKPDAAPAGSGH